MKFEVMVTVIALYPLILGGAIWLFGKYSKKPEQKGDNYGIFYSGAWYFQY